MHLLTFFGQTFNTVEHIEAQYLLKCVEIGYKVKKMSA